MRGKNRIFLDSEISRMVALLYSTDMPITEIAKRMRCSVSSVNSVNRKMNVRQYEGRRSWTCAVLEPVGRHLGSA
jgi:hypothetical protein